MFEMHLCMANSKISWHCALILSDRDSLKSFGKSFNIIILAIIVTEKIHKPSSGKKQINESQP